MNVDGEQEEEEDGGWEKKRVKLSAGRVGKGKEGAIGSDEEEDKQLHRSSVMGKGKSERKQADHLEDGDAILEYNSYPSIIDLHMHLHTWVLSRISRVLPLFLNITHICASIATTIPSFPIIPGTAAMTSNSPDKIMENPSEHSAP